MLFYIIPSIGLLSYISKQIYKPAKILKSPVYVSYRTIQVLSCFLNIILKQIKSKVLIKPQTLSWTQVLLNCTVH